MDRIHQSLIVTRAVLVCAVVLAGLAPSRARAQEVDPNLFSGMSWRLIGPFRAGRALTATGVPGQPEVFYFGAVGGGVWKTMDGGRTWNPIFDSEPIASIGAIAVAPSNPEVVYVGSGEADMRDDISYGNGMYKSTDAGKTWARIGLEDSRQIGQIVVDSQNPDRLFVAALGHAYGANAERGVFRSTDGGATWQKVLFKDENTGAIDLASIPATRASFTPCCGIRAGRPGKFIRRLTAAAGFINPPTVATPGNSSPRDFRRMA